MSNMNKMLLDNMYKGTSIYILDDSYIDYCVKNSNLWVNLREGNVNDIVLAIILNADVNKDTGEYDNNISLNVTINKLRELAKLIISNGFKVHYKIHIADENRNSSFIPEYKNLMLTDPDKFFAQLLSILIKLVMDQKIENICLINEASNITVSEEWKSYWDDIISNIKLANGSMKITGMVYKEQVPCFIDSCDYLGFNIYPAGERDVKVETVENFRRNFYLDYYGRGFISSIHKLCKKHNRPFIVTESGIPPYYYASENPEIWIKKVEDNDEGSKQVQANYLEAMLSVFLGMEACRGVYIWNSASTIGSDGTWGTDPYNWNYELSRNIVKKAYEGILETELSDASINGFLILHEGNHNERADPHSQYLLKKDVINGKIAIKGNELNSGLYGRVCSVKLLTWAPSTLSLSFDVNCIGNKSITNTSNGTVRLRASSRETESTQPNVELTTSGNLNPELVKALLKYDSVSKGWFIDIYIKGVYIYTDIIVRERSKDLVSNSYTIDKCCITYYENESYTTILPEFDEVVEASYYEPSKVEKITTSNGDFDQNCGYKKFADGFMFQWGKKIVNLLEKNSTIEVTVILPQNMNSIYNFIPYFSSNNKVKTIITNVKQSINEDNRMTYVVALENIQDIATSGYLMWYSVGKI